MLILFIGGKLLIISDIIRNTKYPMNMNSGKKELEIEIQAFIQSNFNSKKNSLFLWHCPNLWLEVLLYKEWSELTSLNISYCKIADPKLKHINHKILPNLTHLYLSGNQITFYGLNQLLITQELRLKALNISQNCIGDKGVDLVIRVMGSGLEYLGLDGVGFSGIGLKSMPFLSAINLSQLYISNNKIGCLGVKLLIKAELPNLQQLHLGNCQIGSTGAQNLTKSHWKNLTLLDLKENSIRHIGYWHLKQNIWDQLTMLSIGQTQRGYYARPGCYCKFADVLPLVLAKSTKTKTLYDFMIQNRQFMKRAQLFLRNCLVL